MKTYQVHLNEDQLRMINQVLKEFRTTGSQLLDGVIEMTEESNWGKELIDITQYCQD